MASDPVADGPATNYQFGVDGWGSQVLAPSVADAAVVEPEQVALLPYIAELGALPLDARIKYRVRDTTSDETLVNETSENLPAILGNLPRNHTFAWSTTVTAADGWSSTKTVNSPEWSFRTAAEGETVPEVEEPEGDSAEPQMSARATPNGCNPPAKPSWGRAEFTPVCNKHNICYSSSSRVSRLACDQVFYLGLQIECRRAYPAGIIRATCYGIATAYYTGVRAGGVIYYRGKGSKF